MQLLFAHLLPMHQLLLFLGGLAFGALVNWAIYRLAWNRREISPWGPTPSAAPRRKISDRIPVLGWLGLRREHAIHGRGFWFRPMVLELAMGLGLVWLYWWEVEQQALIVPQVKQLLQLAAGNPIRVPTPIVSGGLTYLVFLSHVALFGLMAAASFIDIDEKIIPDEITVPGTMFGLLLATLMPMSLLPHVAIRDVPPAVGQQTLLPDIPLYVEPVTWAAPNEEPETLGWSTLALGQACWWLWCFALAPRIWRGRHGTGRALCLIFRRVTRELTGPPLAVFAWPGSLAITAVWWWGGVSWLGLFTALIGMAISGGMIWIVRLVGTAALQREAMGFGDVTLMMMVGTFLGWQAGVMVFFIAPFAGLAVGLFQLLLRRDDVIPYGPFLCLGALVVAVRWPNFWTLNIQDAFQHRQLIAIVLLVSFVLLGLMLAVWQTIKRRLFLFENPK